MKFAKLFDMEDGAQVLVMVTYDHDEDETSLNIISQFESARSKQREIFSGENQTEMANKALEAFTEKKAVEFRNIHKNFMEG